MSLQPKTITAFMLGLNHKTDIFRLQRKINEYREPLLAIIPGITLTELWQTLGNFETVLLIVSVLVLITGLMGLLTTLLTTLTERRREMAVLRVVGAHAYHIIILFTLEAALVVTGGCWFGIMLLYSIQRLIQPLLMATYGFYWQFSLLDIEQWSILGLALLLGILLSLLPGWIAYRYSLQDGLIIRI